MSYVTTLSLALISTAAALASPVDRAHGRELQEARNDAAAAAAGAINMTIVYIALGLTGLGAIYCVCRGRCELRADDGTAATTSAADTAATPPATTFPTADEAPPVERQAQDFQDGPVAGRHRGN